MGKQSHIKQKKSAAQACSLPHRSGVFKKKHEAEAASTSGRAKRCGRCRQWAPDD